MGDSLGAESQPEDLAGSTCVPEEDDGGESVDLLEPNYQDVTRDPPSGPRPLTGAPLRHVCGTAMLHGRVATGRPEGWSGGSPLAPSAFPRTTSTGYELDPVPAPSWSDAVPPPAYSEEEEEEAAADPNFAAGQDSSATNGDARELFPGVARLGSLPGLNCYDFRVCL